MHREPAMLFADGVPVWNNGVWIRERMRGRASKTTREKPQAPLATVERCSPPTRSVSAR
jgi:hypothetical protein